VIDFMGVPVSLINVSGWGAFSLLAWLLIRSIIVGKLRTEREVIEIRADRDQRLVEVGAWKTAYEERGGTIDELLSQNRKLLELSETSAHVLKSLPVPGETKEVRSG
jgi:hypothetical protein